MQDPIKYSHMLSFCHLLLFTSLAIVELSVIKNLNFSPAWNLCTVDVSAVQVSRPAQEVPFEKFKRANEMLLLYLHEAVYCKKSIQF